MFAAARFLSDSFSYSERPAYLYKFVSTMQGATAFTRTPYGANSKADALVSISTPAFDRQYPSCPGSGLLPFSLLIFMTQP